MACELTEDLVGSCDSKFNVGGLNELVYFINMADIAGLDVLADGTIQNVSFNYGARAYVIEGGKDAQIATSNQQLSDGQLNYPQTLAIRIVKVSQQVANVIRALAGGTYLVIVKTRALNDAVLPIQREPVLVAYGVYNGLSAGETNGTADTVLGPTKDVASGTLVTLAGTEIWPYQEIVPDPLVYTSNYPNQEFLDQIRIG